MEVGKDETKNELHDFGAQKQFLVSNRMIAGNFIPLVAHLKKYSLARKNESC